MGANQPACCGAVLRVGLVMMLCAGTGAGGEPSGELSDWLVPQHWERDTTAPVLSLGEPGAFDDTHIFAPCVARDREAITMWYSGSRGAVAERVFRLGMARSRDGKTFQRHEANPVLQFGDGKHSVLTATLLRHRDGTAIRQDGRMRMWFSTTHFAGGSGLHTLRETSSRDGEQWLPPSGPLLEHVYAPTVLQIGEGYAMWYTDVSRDPWVIRHATSRDGTSWKVNERPVLALGQSWEQQRLFYPCVVRSRDGVYLMWYGSYWSAHRSKTAIGFAASLDGVRWTKSPHNPVLRPDPGRPWESHYTTSQSVMQQGDGSWRMWYASRKKPPWVNKYFAINTAVWRGPASQRRE